MNRCHKLLIAAILVVCTTGVFAQEGDRLAPSAKKGIGLTIGIDWLTHMELKGAGQDFAILGNPDAGSTSSFSVSEVARVETEPEAAYRLNLGYASAAGWDIALRYTTFQPQGQDQLSNRGERIWATIGNPEWTDLEEDEVGHATAELTYKITTIDVEIGQRLQLTDVFGIRLFGGIRDLNLNRELEVFYREYSPGGDKTLVGRQNDFSGLGLRAGVATNWQLNKVIGIYGSVAMSVIGGETESVLFEEELDNGFRFKTKVQATNTVSTLEMAMGVNIGLNLGDGAKVNLKLGYEYTTYDGLLKPEFADEHMEGLLVNEELDFSQSGWVIGAEIMF